MMYDTLEYVTLFKALSDETRLTIIDLLSVREMCACEILEEVHISQSTLSYHMKILSDCNLVSSCKNGYWTTYWIAKETITQLATFFEAIANANPVPFDLQDCEDRKSK